MKTRLAPIAVALALGAAGCTTENMGSEQVFAICGIPDDACTFQGECGATHIGDVILDIAQQDHLWLPLQLNNQRVPTTDAETGRTDTADAYLQTYDSEYSVVAVPAPGTPSAVVAPGTSGLVVGTVPSAGSSVAAVQPITPALGAALVPQVPVSTPTSPKYVDVVSHFRLKGVYGDGSSFTTARFDIPVRICKGCLPVICPSTTLASSCPPDAPGQVPGRVDACVTP